MKEVDGSIWVHFLVAGHIVCITTNGTMKKNGEAVMGRGNAKQATICIPKITRTLGDYIKRFGNVAGTLHFDAQNNWIVNFPVKHNWWERADLDLIARSALWLHGYAETSPGTIFHLPRPGCGNGKLDWEREVKPIVNHLPDNVWVHHMESPSFDLIGD